MRLAVILLVIVVCGCIGGEKEIVREYVCPDHSIVDSPEKCPIAQETTTSSQPQTTTTTSAPTVSTSNPTSSTNPPAVMPAGDPYYCLSPAAYKQATCEALAQKNASLCPLPGLEYEGELLTSSLFRSLADDIFSEAKLNLTLDVFQKKRTCVMAIADMLDSSRDSGGKREDSVCCPAYSGSASTMFLASALIWSARSLDADIISKYLGPFVKNKASAVAYAETPRSTGIESCLF